MDQYNFKPLDNLTIEELSTTFVGQYGYADPLQWVLHSAFTPYPNNLGLNPKWQDNLPGYINPLVQALMPFVSSGIPGHKQRVILRIPITVTGSILWGAEGKASWDEYTGQYLLVEISNLDNGLCPCYKMIIQPNLDVEEYINTNIPSSWICGPVEHAIFYTHLMYALYNDPSLFRGWEIATTLVEFPKIKE